MTSKTIVRFVVPMLAAATLLSGCAKQKDEPAPAASGACEGTTATDLSAVSVDTGEAEPKITACKPFSVTETKIKVLTEGEGAVTGSGDRLTVAYVGMNATDGKVFDSSFGAGKKPTTVILSASSAPAGVVKALTGVKVGARVLAAVPAKDGYGTQGVPAAGIGPTDTLFFYFEVKSASKVLKRATGTPVAPKPGLPQVLLSPTGMPSIVVPKTPPPASLVIQQLIKGTGPVVKAGQSITVNYTGVLWAGGKQFDSSWGKSPAQFSIGTGNVIKGWDTGLVGQPVGSQVLLIVPPNEGYGAAGNGEIKGTDTLVFVVDILDAA